MPNIRHTYSDVSHPSHVCCAAHCSCFWKHLGHRSPAGVLPARTGPMDDV
jgi:hypothetical protein